MTTVTICSDFGAQENKVSHCLSERLQISKGEPICRLGSNKTGHGTTDWFQIGKGVHQGCVFSPCVFNLYAEYIV